ncbi:MAG: 3-hydroxybutyryl-CoA dehydrogenase [Saprospiraceae bacterium]|nr:3-hydroxybutyryl-CoA dehydrogenase [Saprospiraceae bacterium]
MKKTGLVGAGTMGQGIILAVIIGGCDVFVFESNESMVEKALNNIQKFLNKEISKNNLTQEQANSLHSKIHFVKNINELYSCDIIIEAIIENLEAKQNLFKQLSSLVSDSCILATNTSSLSITSIAASVNNPERFIGLHFFNPAHIMKLVEVIPAIQTSQITVERSVEYLKHCRKLSVVAKDTPGFIVNRIARPYYGEALKMLEEGIAKIEDIDSAMLQKGFKMGPFALMDFIGHDINYNVTEIVYNAFYQDPRYRPSFIQKRLVEAGFLGVKSERGFYTYGSNVQKLNSTISDTDSEKISSRILVMLINEAADALYFKIATKEDIEISMTKGVNYPKGLLQWADEIGIKKCVQQLDNLFDKYHDPRYRCSLLLRKMASQGENFLK